MVAHPDIGQCLSYLLLGLALLLVSQPVAMYHLTHTITSSFFMDNIYLEGTFLAGKRNKSEGTFLAGKRKKPEGTFLAGKRNNPEGTFLAVKRNKTELEGTFLAGKRNKPEGAFLAVKRNKTELEGTFLAGKRNFQGTSQPFRDCVNSFSPAAPAEAMPKFFLHKLHVQTGYLYLYTKKN